MEFNNQRELFEHIWETREHVSEIDGSPLVNPGHYLFFNQFSHILPKSIYPSAKLYEENVILINATQHDTWTRNPGKLKLLAEWVWVFEEYELLKIKYHQDYFR